MFASDIAPPLCYAPSADAPLVPLVFYPTAWSPRYRYAGAIPLKLVDATTGRVVGEADFSGEGRDVLLILTSSQPMKDRPARYRVHVVDDGTPHAAGELLILNASGLKLSGSVNRRSVTLPDGNRLSTAIGSSAVIQLRTQFKDRSYQAYADTIRLEPASRALLLLLPPYHRGSLEVQSRVLIDVPGREQPLLE